MSYAMFSASMTPGMLSRVYGNNARLGSAAVFIDALFSISSIDSNRWVKPEHSVLSSPMRLE